MLSVVVKKTDVSIELTGVDVDESGLLESGKTGKRQELQQQFAYAQIGRKRQRAVVSSPLRNQFANGLQTSFGSQIAINQDFAVIYGRHTTSATTFSDVYKRLFYNHL
jgi:hypothetical protein